MPRAGHQLTRTEWAIAMALGALSLGVYVRTLAPDLLYGDSGEFQVLASMPGMTHPTGYPVYVILGWLFARLPLGDIAYRANLMSAVCAALTVSLLYLSGIVLTRRRWTPVVGAAALAVSYTFWSQAVLAELYTVAAAFMAATLLLVLAWHDRGDARLLVAAGVLGGLSLGVHLSVALMAPAVLIFMLTVRASRRAWRLALIGALAGAALWLVSLAALDAIDAPTSYYHATVRPSLSVWGMTAEDFDSMSERLAFQLSARQFQQYMFTLPPEGVWSRARAYADGLTGEFAGGVVALAGVGAAATWRRRGWRVGLLLLLTFAAHLVYDLNYDIGDIHVFFIPTYFVLALWASVGAGWVVGWIEGALRGGWRAHAEPALAVLGVVAAIAPFAASRADALTAGKATFINGDYPMPVDKLEEPRARAEALVAALPDDAVLFVNWDLLYPLYYIAHVEQGRTAMAFHEIYPQDDVHTFAYSALDYVAAALEDGRPVYTLERLPELRARFRLRPMRSPEGRLYEVLPR